MKLLGKTFSTMHQKNHSVENQVSNNNNTLFNKNLHRINEELKYVNQYYTPKYEPPVENHYEVIQNVESNESLNEKTDKSINFYYEFYKIAMNEIESMRKAQVQKLLNRKAKIWEHKRQECSTISTHNNEEFKCLVRKRLAIDKNFNKELLNSNNDELYTKLRKNQILFDEKTKNFKFIFMLNTANNLLNKIKHLLSENQIKPQLLSDGMQKCMAFEADIKTFENMSQNFNEHNLLALSKLVQHIQIFNEQCVESVLKHQQIENIPIKIDDHTNKKNKIPIENFTFKINENNEHNHSYKINTSKVNDISEEAKNFTFKIDEVKSDEYNTFKFKIDEEVVDNNIAHFSFNINDIKHKEIKNNICYNFEDDYKRFLENHLSIQEHLKKVENSYSSFLHQDDFKSLRQELTKSINTPINSISSVSPWHMKDKFEKLDALLKCNTVKTGNSTVSASSHKDALIFCKDTLAKKIINIGEHVVSVKTETAFEVASIVNELWRVYPDFGLLLYARFKQKCPCLIPYNVAKTNDETDEEYYKSLGYNYTNEVVEKQDRYVKRMTGIIRLFAAIIVTETKSGKALSISQAWMIIAATVHLIPQLDVTAILLHEMLMITGYNLKQAYGKQFIKMLQYIDTKHMKNIEEVTPIGCGGPVQRLKTFISKSIQIGYIAKPKGIISNRFW